MLVCAVQWSEPVICRHIFPPPWACLPIPCPSHLGCHRARKLFILHTVVYVYVNATLSIRPILSFLHCVHKSLLYISISIPALVLFLKGAEVLFKLGHFQMPKQVTWLSLLSFYCNSSRRWPMRPDDLGKSYYNIFQKWYPCWTVQLSRAASVFFSLLCPQHLVQCQHLVARQGISINWKGSIY